MVVGKTFNEIVMDTSKDVFVKYYSAGSEASEKFAPTWAKLADTTPDVVVSVFETSQNEAENAVLKSRNFPILVFYPKDNKKGITYEGEKKLDSIKKWLKEQVGNNESVKDDL